MKGDNTVLLVLGGLGLLWLISKSSPTAVAAQQQALASSANLQSQAISANQNIANTAAIAGGVTGAVNALTGSTSSSNYTAPVYYNS
jgi:hypothetical protein